MNAVSESGFFVTFEGIEAAGKTTALSFCAEMLRQADLSYLTTREPGGTDLSERLRFLLKESELELSSYSEALLFFAAREDHLRKSILPALACNKVVLSDRFADSTFAYQSGKGGISLREYCDLLSFLSKIWVEPDCTIFIDISVEVSEKRISADHSRGTDRFESRSKDFHESVRKKYYTLCEQFPERIIRIDGEQRHEEVAAEVWRVLSKRLAKKGIIS